MAKLYLSEFSANAKDTNGNRTAYLPEPTLGTSVVTFTTATQSSAFGLNTKLVRIVADADCRVKFGANPTATASDEFLTAKTEYVRGVNPGDKLSVYDGSS